ncbi:MAG: threonine ammonia-lyase [Planctomycetota bacterium]|jgi:threonine dehydratase
MLTLQQIEAADGLRGKGRFRATPLHFPPSLNTRISPGTRLYLKLELFQRTGSFKVRGATAKVLALSEQERARGIVAASAGNHAQGVALAAAAIGVRARIVMPEYAPLTKREATRQYGGEVILNGASYDEAYAHAVALRDADGGTLVHAFDDEQIMAGQGTVGLEILRDLPDVEAVICPVGGGGLISGVATAIKARRPRTKIIGVQAEGADSAVASFRAGRRIASHGVETIADGIKVQQVGERCFDSMRRVVDDMVTVTDVEICRAMLLLDEHAHIAAEPAGATATAAFLNGSLPLLGGPTVVLVSGGNIDTFEKTRYIRRALVHERRNHAVRLRLVDRRGSKPRAMATLFRLLGEHEMNVLDIAYRRDTPDLPLGLVEVELLLETRGDAHATAITEALRQAGFHLV